jgi:hypothetical protein
MKFFKLVEATKEEVKDKPHVLVYKQETKEIREYDFKQTNQDLSIIGGKGGLFAYNFYDLIE